MTTTQLLITGRNLAIARLRAYLAQRDPLALLAVCVAVPLLFLALIRALPWPEHRAAVERPMRPIIMVATPTAAPAPTPIAAPEPQTAPVGIILPSASELDAAATVGALPIAPVVVILPAAPVELAAPTPAPEWIATVESHEAGAIKNKRAVASDDWCSGVHLVTDPNCAGAP